MCTQFCVFGYIFKVTCTRFAVFGYISFHYVLFDKMTFQTSTFESMLFTVLIFQLVTHCNQLNYYLLLQDFASGVGGVIGKELVEVVEHIVVCGTGVTHHEIHRLLLGYFGDSGFVHFAVEASH